MRRSHSGVNLPLAANEQASKVRNKGDQAPLMPIWFLIWAKQGLGIWGGGYQPSSIVPPFSFWYKSKHSFSPPFGHCHPVIWLPGNPVWLLSSKGCFSWGFRRCVCGGGSLFPPPPTVAKKWVVWREKGRGERHREQKCQHPLFLCLRHLLCSPHSDYASAPI